MPFWHRVLKQGRTSAGPDIELNPQIFRLAVYCDRHLANGIDGGCVWKGLRSTALGRSAARQASRCDASSSPLRSAMKSAQTDVLSRLYDLLFRTAETLITIAADPDRNPYSQPPRTLRNAVPG